MNKGFTLVELIVVIAILSLLVIITTPAYSTISNNIKMRNYESKKSTIEKQTIDYVEKYWKDKVYIGTQTNCINFTAKYLIQNGIISSDSNKAEEEYILNTVTNEQYSEEAYIQIYYDTKSLKLKANHIEDFWEEGSGEKTCNEVYTY